MQPSDTSPPPGSFAFMLRRYRLDRRLTQEELAHAAGLSVRAVRNAELGRVRSPHRDSVRRLADALGLPADDCRRLTEAARGHRVPPAPDEATNTIYLRPDSTITVVIQPGSNDELNLVHINATPADAQGDPAILLTLNRNSPEPPDP